MLMEPPVTTVVPLRKTTVSPALKVALLPSVTKKPDQVEMVWPASVVCDPTTGWFRVT